jgi:hypothetical protein
MDGLLAIPALPERAAELHGAMCGLTISCLSKILFQEI